MKRIFAFAGLIALIAMCFVGCSVATYTVTYSVDGSVTTEQVESGGVASCEEPDPVSGKTFDGWYTDEALTARYDETSPVTADITLYGTWRDNAQPAPTRYTVTFIVDGIPYEVIVNEGQTASFDEPKKSGWTFSGWYTDEDCTKKFDLSTPITGALTLYAGWTEVHIPQTFTVTFNTNGGTANPAIPSQTITEGGKVVRPENDPARAGYIFRGWYKDGELYDFDDAVGMSFTLTVEWKLDVPATQGTAQATSAAADHAADLAIDGDADTYWQASAEGEAALTVDLGEMAEIRSVWQVFASSAKWSFVIEASADNQMWAEISAVALEEADDSYEVEANGFFRYVRIRILSGGIPSSREFHIETFGLSSGTNIALGMKGSSGDWAAGNETEMAFDGNYSTFWCANDSSFNNKYLAVEWTYMTYVNYVEFYFQNDGTHNFEVEGRLEDGSWIKLEEAADHVGQSFRIAVGREVSAVLIREFAGPGWANVTEMNVYGFKDAASGITPAAEDGYDVYDIGESYISRVVTDSDAVEYSADGTKWTALTLDGGTALADVQASYIRVKEGSDVKIYATQFKTDLARYVTPTASSFSDTNHCPGIATMNPENVWVQSGDGVGYFWCALNGNEQNTLELDFGRICVINGFKYTFQDATSATENAYKLKIEVSENKDSWTAIFDNFDTGTSNGVLEESFAGVRARYVKITVLYENNWANCKNVQFYGVGAPERDIEIREGDFE